jgi:hypothetical protein
MRPIGVAYEQVRGRISDLVGNLDQEAAMTPVPACPGWSVHGVVSHLTGICADVLTGNLAGAATDAWTGAQVEARRDRPIADVVAEWADVGPKIAAMADDFPGWMGAQVVADATTHEHDVRGALARPGARDTSTVGIGVDFFVNVFLHPGVTTLGLGPLEVIADGWRWVVGAGEPLGGDLDEVWGKALLVTDPLPMPEAPLVGTLRIEPFELFRALSGRRSAAEIRGYDWSVDPEPYLPVFGFGPFTVRDTDLGE